MRQDLGLQALAEIQAREAQPIAQVFRNKWLDGGYFEDTEGADAWLRTLIDGDQTTAGRVQLWYRPPFAADGRLWTSNGGSWSSDEHAVLRDLADTALALSSAFGWEWYEQTSDYVLANLTPCLQLVRADILDLEYEGTAPLVSGSIPGIQLTIRPQATMADVTLAYREALGFLYGRRKLGPRERIRAMSSERTRDLAVIGGRIALGDFASWADALETYRKEHPTDSTYHRPHEPPDKGLFRRDVRRSYAQATGQSLDFQPDRQKSKAATVSYTLRGTDPTQVLEFTNAPAWSAGFVRVAEASLIRTSRQTGKGTADDVED